MSERSKLVRMRISNFGCIGEKGIEVSLDDIVCLVGVNNSGKSTVLRAYEVAVNMAEIKPDEVNDMASGKSATVELWVHIPEGAENIDAKWKEREGDLLLVRSKWEWPPLGGKPTRHTWNPAIQQYAEDGNASGLDQVFTSRLPRPFRIGSLEDPAAEHQKLLELVLEPIKNQIAALMKDEKSSLREKFVALQKEAEKPVESFRSDLEKVQTQVNKSYNRVFSGSQVKLTVTLGELSLDPSNALSKASRVDIVEPHGQTAWHRQGTGSQRALFWSMLEVRSELNRISERRKQVAKLKKDKERELSKLAAKLNTLKKKDAIENCKREIASLEVEGSSLNRMENGRCRVALGHGR
ncbi:MAG: AAA family ATPase [Planctomycetes bacterium]|nr:AAA family ATPase [Planctomycetota bacterium]